jgi:hypothetical protein
VSLYLPLNNVYRHYWNELETIKIYSQKVNHHRPSVPSLSQGLILATHITEREAVSTVGT